MLVFVVKTLVILNLVVWVRWTLPRIRVDQMMSLCWKYLVPFAFVAFVATLAWQILVARVPAAAQVVGGLSVLALLVTSFFFVRQTRQNISAVGDRVDFTNW
jgi:NADH-quinone oxidoreductase subunit H